MTNQLEVLKLKKKHLKENYNLRKECLDEDILSTRISLNKTFRKKYKFIIFDVLMLFLILFNIGALFLTNTLVVKATTMYSIPLVLVEANPVAAQVHGWKPVFDKFMHSLVYFAVVIKQFILWSLMIVVYLYGRFHVTSVKELRTLGLILAFGTTLGLFDFFNDYGYFIGKMLWGV